jgi:hypothetical protein
MFSSIPFPRLLLYGMLAGLLPALFLGLYFFSKQSSLDELSHRIEELQTLTEQQEKRQATNLAVIRHFQDADHFYIDKHLEVLTFLEPEVEALQKIAKDKNFTDDEQVKKRLEYLSGPGNTLRFTEGVVQKYPQFQETTETLIHPVEVNMNDLQKILTFIEGIPLGSYKPAPHRPQMLILDFKLDKKQLPDKNEVYTLNLKLLKREFL